jgi:hypothetical protein
MRPVEYGVSSVERSGGALMSAFTQSLVGGFFVALQSPDPDAD